MTLFTANNLSEEGFRDLKDIENALHALFVRLGDLHLNVG
jgi:hypothetical protein